MAVKKKDAQYASGPIPAGTIVPVIVTKSEYKTANVKKTGLPMDIFEMQFYVLGGGYEGRTIRDSLICMAERIPGGDFHQHGNCDKYMEVLRALDLECVQKVEEDQIFVTDTQKDAEVLAESMVNLPFVVETGLTKKKDDQPTSPQYTIIRHARAATPDEYASFSEAFQKFMTKKMAENAAPGQGGAGQLPF